MSKNNLDNMTFENNDTYHYYTEPLLASEHKTSLKAVDSDTDNVDYSSLETDLCINNNIIVGKIKFNRFQRVDESSNKNISSFLVTLITPNGLLNFNYSAILNNNTNLYVVGQSFSTYATYKSGIYSNYLYVKINIIVNNNNYRIVTVSY